MLMVIHSNAAGDECISNAENKRFYQTSDENDYNNPTFNNNSSKDYESLEELVIKCEAYNFLTLDEDSVEKNIELKRLKLGNLMLFRKPLKEHVSVTEKGLLYYLHNIKNI